MVTNREKLILSIFILLLLALTTVPLILAIKAGGDNHVFGGFIFNPLDGNSYITKMRQGYDGEWSFRLSYSFERGQASFIHLFYIFLGHLARLFSLPLIFVFHLFRVLFSALMYWTLFQFTAKMFKNKYWRWVAFILVSVGSGLGWLALFFELNTSDLWVAETYPFLSASTNVHFPAATALQLWFFMPRKSERFNWSTGIKTTLATILLVIISPFGMVIVGIVYGGNLLWCYLRKEDWLEKLSRFMILSLVSGPFLIYYLWTSINHPELSQWNIQNVSSSPAIWDLFISLSPSIILALISIPRVWKSDKKEHHLLMIWMIISLILIYLPFNLQRRFLQAVFIPIALLAVIALENIVEIRPSLKKIAITLMFLLAVPTNLVLLFGSLLINPSNSPRNYLSKDEFQAIQWIDENTPEEAHFLAGPEIGIFIPSYSHALVYYGHPVETGDAEQKLQLLNDFYSGNLYDSNAWLNQTQIGYVFYGPREKNLGKLAEDNFYEEVFQNTEVTIYRVNIE